MRGKFSKKILLFLCIATAAFSYQIYNLVPERITLIEGQDYNLPKFISQENSRLKLLGVPYKSVRVDVIPDEEVLVGGQSIGVEMNVDGVQILGFSEVRNMEGKKCCPARECGLQEGDVIRSVNGEEIASAARLVDLVSSGAVMDLSYERDGQTHSVTVTPVQSSEDGQYRLGLWARDGTTGIGTLTFVVPSQKKFGALGHSITDADTNQPVAVGSGAIYLSRITAVTKGAKGAAGELRGSFSPSPVGQIVQNTDFGIFGTYTGAADASKTVPIASRNEIQTGPAQIYCCVEGTEVRAYDIEIERVDLNSYNNKSMIIRVTDEELIRKTGGIVQGMSGSPIVQNGKLVGAVTHVLLNDPCRGYGIFIEIMVAMCRNG